jgi:Tol biopolymer transport system component
VKVLAAAFLIGVALSATGAAAPQSSPCCGEDFDPQWSRDGSRIAFVRREPTGLSAFYTMASGGGDERRLVSLGSDYSSWRQRPPLLTPDWTRVALIGVASALRRPSLQIKSVDGSQVREIGSNVVSFAWSPDSRHIAFHETDSGNHSTIFVAESDGSGLRSLGPGEAPAWSPDGSRIAFVSPAGLLYEMQADGSGRRLVYDGHGAQVYAPSWSPLGDRIAFYGASSLIVVASDGTRLYDTFADYLSKPPKWSFDGSLIASEGPNIFSVLRIGTTDRWSFQDRFDPSWSPLANELTASFSGRCRRSAIYRMSVTSTSRRLTLDCHIRGTDAPDVLKGTSYTDIITGLAGDDELLGADGADRLIGGPGGDTLLGGNMGDRLEGGYGSDLLIGGNIGRDYSDPTDVEDSLFGGPGPDDLRGGAARDILSGDAGNDVLRGGPGADTLYGGPGSDRILASGDTPDEFGRPVRDIVRCGAGRHDVAFVGRQDTVHGCEIVHRR